MYKVGSYFLTICFIACSLGGAFAQNHSIAREWNEELLEAIRNDFARPTIHARNLFHSSVAMYDAWAAYEPSANTFFLGKSLGNFNCPFEGIPVPEDKKAAQEEAISYAVYRLLTFRFQGSPNAAITQFGLNNLMEELGYDIGITSTNYQDGNPAHLGNYIGQQLQLFGFQDGSNELGSFENLFYEPVNPSLVMDDPGNDMVDPNRWQPLSLSNFVDQAGNPIDEAPGFLSPEWGYVVPFAMQESDRAIYTRDGFDYPVWNDPGVPPLLDPDTPSGLEDNFKWGFTLVSVWASHLDPSDGVLWDISPASIGNIAFEDLPQNFDEHPDFYNYLEGGDISPGYSVNPKTGLPYEPQIVPRGDYARILAEFWADGPDSETPPGHWFVITNYVSDNPALEKRWKGEGPILDDLEWDVKSYFTLGGAMHDAAISAWSNKGYYDYVRPVSVVRYLAELGQSSDPALPNYHPGGMPLVPGKIELVEAGDPLAGANNEHVNKVKLYTWRGPDFIANEATDVAGVGWILAENWWPYQRPTFVTPPFAGYVSGHSTYSRAAAETLTRITGDPYFPGGLGEFPAPQNEFLVFEDGPSVDVTLQWATYRDASDQCSLSRIWGGIHPPADDIPGRQIGEKVGNEAFDYADLFIGAQNPEVVVLSASDPTINTENTDQELVLSVEYDRAMNTMVTPTLVFATDNPADVLTLATNEWTSATTFTWRFTVEGIAAPLREPVVQITGAEDESGKTQEAFAAKPFQIDLQRPVVMQFTANNAMLADADVQTNALNLTVLFDEPMDTSIDPTITISAAADFQGLVPNATLSGWISEQEYVAAYDLSDADEVELEPFIEVSGVTDLLGNAVEPYNEVGTFQLDTKNPTVLSVEPSAPILNSTMMGAEALTLTVLFDEPMDEALPPSIIFPNANPIAVGLSLNETESFWLSPDTYVASYDFNGSSVELSDITLVVGLTNDLFGNQMAPDFNPNVFSIDTKAPTAVNLDLNTSILNDATVGDARFTIVQNYDEPMDATSQPSISFSDPAVGGSLSLNASASQWISPTVYRSAFDVIDENIELEAISYEVTNARDEGGNDMEAAVSTTSFAIDTRNPALLFLAAQPEEVTNENVGTAGFSIVAIFDQELDPDQVPSILFPVETPQAISLNTEQSSWLNNTTYQAVFDVAALTEILEDIDVEITSVSDLAGNPTVVEAINLFSIMLDDFVNTNELPIAFEGLKVFPNPTSGTQLLYVEMNKLPSDLTFKLLNLQGQVVQAWAPESASGNRISLAMGDLSNGVYLLHLQSREGQYVVRVVKQ